MKIAIAVWQGRVSPVFDSSRRILLLDAQQGNVVARSEAEIDGELPQQRARRLQELGVEVLVCGAISRLLSQQITQTGIRLIAFIAGDVEEIVRAYFEKRLPSAEFLMPGCCGERRHGHGPAGGRGAGRGRCGCPSRKGNKTV